MRFSLSPSSPSAVSVVAAVAAMMALPMLAGCAPQEYAAHVHGSQTGVSGRIHAQPVRLPGVAFAFPTEQCSSIESDPSVSALYDKACDDGDVNACFEASVRYACGAGVPREMRTAADRADQACAGGSIPSCGNAGLLRLGLADLETGDVARAVHSLRKGCLANDVASCNNLALVMLHGVAGGIPDGVGAVTLLEKLCARGNVKSCGNAAVIYIAGIGVPRDVERGVELASSACDAGDAASCNAVEAARGGRQH